MLKNILHLLVKLCRVKLVRFQKGVGEMEMFALLKVKVLYV